jgi:hypothetical protein
MPNLQEPVIDYRGLNMIARLAELRNQNDERMRRLALQLAEKDRQLELQAMNYESLDRLRTAQAAKDEAQATRATTLADLQSEKAGSIIEWQKAVNAIDADPGTPEYRVQLNRVRNDFPRLMASEDGKRLLNEALDNHRQTAGEARNAWMSTAKDYITSVKAVTGSNSFRPDDWADAQEKGKKYRIIAADGTLLPPTTSKEDVAAKGARYQRIDAKDYDSLLKQREKVLEHATTGVMDRPDDVSVPKKIKVRSPDGKVGLIPDTQLQDALQEGYQQVQ